MSHAVPRGEGAHDRCDVEYDTLIAGQALARGLTLVTRNIRKFERVEGLRVEDREG